MAHWMPLPGAFHKMLTVPAAWASWAVFASSGFLPLSLVPAAQSSKMVTDQKCSDHEEDDVERRVMT